MRKRKDSGDIATTNGKHTMRLASRQKFNSYVLWKLFKYSFCFLVTNIALFFALVTFHNVSPWQLSRHQTNIIDSFSLALGLQENAYAVVIDAGSTGSRVLAFTFNRILSDGTLKLHGELFREVKPGVSHYADYPDKAADSVSELVKLAQEHIPEAHWKTTPIVLKATAGLRLLPETKANGILSELRGLFSRVPFQSSHQSVDIMDGTQEGLFSWFTVNFLLDKLSGEPLDSVVALDLGGGSTQITFVPSPSTSHTVPENFMLAITAFGKNLNIYTHSYLGLGLMAARHDILKYNNTEHSKDLRSSCVNPIVNTHWDYGGVTYNIRGPLNPQYVNVKGTAGRIAEDRPIVSYPTCYGIIREIVQNKVHQPQELNTRHIVAFSYYFDRATENGLIDPFEGGVVTVQKILQTAREVCSIPNVDQPFACLDMTYIGALLHDGYGLDGDVKIHLYKKIEGHETSWAMGAAFHVMDVGVPH